MKTHTSIISIVICILCFFSPAHGQEQADLVPVRLPHNFSVRLPGTWKIIASGSPMIETGLTLREYYKESMKLKQQPMVTKETMLITAESPDGTSAVAITVSPPMGITQKLFGNIPDEKRLEEFAAIFTEKTKQLGLQNSFSVIGQTKAKMITLRRVQRIYLLGLTYTVLHENEPKKAMARRQYILPISNKVIMFVFSAPEGSDAEWNMQLISGDAIYSFQQNLY